MTDSSASQTYDIEAIQAMLPHRYPFLMVDRVLACEPGKSLRAMKNVTVNEPFFQGHFPGHPVMPGVMIIEAMAQSAGLLVQISAPPRVEGQAQPIFYLVKVDKARFNRIVVPGDQLIFEVELLRTLRNMGLYACRAIVDGKDVASAEMLCARKG
jgi:3-hydroxyacyl-[acyl-carrier-protein] dehydratase